MRELNTLKTGDGIEVKIFYGKRPITFKLALVASKRQEEKQRLLHIKDPYYVYGLTMICEKEGLACDTFYSGGTTGFGIGEYDFKPDSYYYKTMRENFADYTVIYYDPEKINEFIEDRNIEKDKERLRHANEQTLWCKNINESAPKTQTMFDFEGVEFYWVRKEADLIGGRCVPPYMSVHFKNLAGKVHKMSDHISSYISHGKFMGVKFMKDYGQAIFGDVYQNRDVNTYKRLIKLIDEESKKYVKILNDLKVSLSDDNEVNREVTVKRYVCESCGHEVHSSHKPQPIKWSDGHVCHFVLEPENFEEKDELKSVWNTMKKMDFRRL